MNLLEKTVKLIETHLNNDPDLNLDVKKIVIDFTRFKDFIFYIHYKNNSVYNMEFKKHKKLRVWNPKNSNEKEMEFLQKQVKFFKDNVLENYYQKLVYGKTNTYKYEIDEEKLKSLVKVTNRRKTQTNFLFQVVNGDFEKLVKFEKAVKVLSISYCPGDEKTLNSVLMKYHLSEKDKTFYKWERRFAHLLNSKEEKSFKESMNRTLKH